MPHSFLTYLNPVAAPLLKQHLRLPVARSFIRSAVAEPTQLTRRVVNRATLVENLAESIDPERLDLAPVLANGVAGLRGFLRKLTFLRSRLMATLRICPDMSATGC